MSDEHDALESPRSRLEKTVGELIEDAQRVLSAESRLRELLSAYRAVTEGLDLDQVLHRIVDAAVSLAHADYGALGVIGTDGSLERFLHTGMSPEQVAAIGHLPSGRGLLGAVITEGRTIRLPHLSEDPRSVGFPEHHPPMHAFLGVPVRTRDQTFGNLYLARATDDEFSPEDADLIESLAATAGIAIDNARLFDTARRQERLATALSQISAAFLAPAGGDVLSIVAEHVGSVVDADLITVVVPDDGAQRMRVAAAFGAAADRLQGVTFAAHSSIAAEAMQSGRIVSTVDDRAFLDGRLTLGSAAAVPLSVNQRSVGALCVGRLPGRGAFTAVELETVNEFTAQASIAITLAWARRDRQRLDLAEDRARIARDLHDHVIQRLFGAGLSLQALAAADPAHQSELEAQVTELDAAITEIRTAIFMLRARPHSRAMSPRHLILDVASEAARSLPSAPRLAFKGPVDLAIDGDLVDDVLAVIRELLANVARHARADSSTVTVTATSSMISVAVEDDGVGIPADAHRAGGIANLAERAARRGGSFDVQRRAAGGTRAFWKAPIPADDEA